MSFNITKGESSIYISLLNNYDLVEINVCESNEEDALIELDYNELKRVYDEIGYILKLMR